MISDEFTIDDEYADDPGAYLRISRNATAEDLADLLPGKTVDEREEWLRQVVERDGNTVTLSVVVEVPESTSIRAFGEAVPVREITGLIIGPPGSEQFLRRPGATVVNDRDHAGLGLGCTPCGGPCTIDGPVEP